MTLDQRINKLRHGQEIEIGRNGDVYTTVERSRDVIKFVRHTPNGFEVFHKVRVDSAR